jgi:outer membrane lipoprotein SlyB
MDHRSFRALTLASFAALLLAGCAHRDVTTQSSGATQSTHAGGALVAPSNSTFYGKLDVPIGTKTSHNGDAFTLTQTDTLLHKNPALHGAVIDGHVDGVVAAGPMKNPAMTLVFDDIRLPDGTKEPVDVVLVSTRQFDPKSHKLRTIGLMVGGAIAGHTIAAHTHSKHGALKGAVGGYVVSQALKTDVAVPAGSVVVLRFKSPVTAGASAAPGGN